MESEENLRDTRKIVGKKNCFRETSLFTEEQVTFIVMKFEDLKSMKLVQRSFRKEFYPKNPRKVPYILAFYRIVKRFKEEESVHPMDLYGK